ncbi:hypothetical protein ABZP36_014929 [Zizania latifolia]
MHAGSVAIIPSNLPSSSQTAQYPGHRVRNSGALHNPYVHYPTGSSHGHVSYNAQAEPPITYPHSSEEEFTPVSSHVDNRRAALKRKNPIIHPADSIHADGYYGGSSSSTQFSNYLQPNVLPLSESLHPQMPLSIGTSNWNGQCLASQEGSQRNVRARHNYANISAEPRSVHSTSNVSPSTLVRRNGASFSTQTRIVPSAHIAGASVMSSREMPYSSSIGSSYSAVFAVPTLHGSSDSAIYTNGASAPRAVHGDTVPTYAHLSSLASSSSTAAPHEAIIPSYPPATSAATSISTRATEPFSIRAVSSSRLRHAPVGQANSVRNRRARSAYYGFHPSMIDAQRLAMMQQLVFRTREAPDPHRDMRMDIDSMSYEDLLALGESIGNVNTGLTEEKISGCLKEVICCSSDETQNDQDDESCAICLEEYKDKCLLGILKCNHEFHSGCIKKWLQVKNSCPVCKAAAA